MNSMSLNSHPTSTDVLVVGNGPIGATLAALLGRYGVSTLVVDKIHDVLLMPRAIALDNEALRILQQAGLREDAFDKIVIPEVRMNCPIVGQFGRANTSGSLDGHPKLVTFYQPDLEHSVRKQCEAFPHVLSLGGFELLALQQDENGVDAELRSEDGTTHHVRSRYLIGADGASSKVRTLIDQDFKGESYAEDWLIVDASGRERVAIGHVEFLCDYRRPTPHMPAPGGRERWEFMLKAGESREQMEDAGHIAKLLEKWIDPRHLKIERQAVYRFHARCCNSFQKGRVFLAGDAAHITPPFVGQGLVAGLRDASNLAWKLAFVLQDRASPTILDSYDQERRPHAQEMINLAKLMGRLVMPRNAPGAMMIHGLMRVMRLIPAARRYFDELDIKPKNIFKQGLFKAHIRGQHLRSGGLFPQGLVRQRDGSIVLSDTVLADTLVLVGLGCNPRMGLGREIQQRWELAGGCYLQIGLQGQKGSADMPFVEDIGQALLADNLMHTVAVVRPDRIVMHSSHLSGAETLLRETLRLLNP